MTVQRQASQEGQDIEVWISVVLSPTQLDAMQTLKILEYQLHMFYIVRRLGGAGALLPDATN